MSPPRGRFPSHSDAIPAPEDVYQILREHDLRMGAIELKIDMFGEKQDDLATSVKDAVREIKDSNGSESRKMFVAIAVAALTTVGGVFGAAKLERPATPITIPRSALDTRLDACRPMPPGQSREDCFARVMAETEH